MASTRQIALAIDPTSLEVNKTIKWAMENLFRPSDDIHVVMVMILDCEFGEQEFSVLPPVDSLESIEQQLILEKLKAMETVVTKLKESGFQVHSHVIKSDSTHACQVLTEYLDKNTMDCIVMGSRNLSGWKRFFMGSFSDYIQTHTNRPVLIVK